MPSQKPAETDVLEDAGLKSKGKLEGATAQHLLPLEEVKQGDCPLQGEVVMME